MATSDDDLILLYAQAWSRVRHVDESGDPNALDRLRSQLSPEKFARARELHDRMKGEQRAEREKQLRNAPAAPTKGAPPSPADAWFAVAGRRACQAEVAKCESPAEEALVAGFFAVGLKPTQQFDIGEARVDFAFVSNRVVVEVDGYEFHHKTHEQVSRDKARDRRLATLGWRVLRYTALDVFENAVGCAQEVAALLEGQAA